MSTKGMVQGAREQGMRHHKRWVRRRGLVNVGCGGVAFTQTAMALMILGLCSGGCKNNTDAESTPGTVAEEGAPCNSSSVSGEDSQSYEEAPATVLENRCSDKGIRRALGGPYEALEVTVIVSVRVPGQYTLSGQLFKDGTLVSARPSGSSALPSAVAFIAGQGETNVALRFSGAEIRASGLDGPYQVELFLLDSEGGVVGHCEWTTAQYEHTDFAE